MFVPVINRLPSGVQLRQKIGHRILFVAVFINLNRLKVFKIYENTGEGHTFCYLRCIRSKKMKERKG